jgi:hypothetical protein
MKIQPPPINSLPHFWGRAGEGAYFRRSRLIDHISSLKLTLADVLRYTLALAWLLVVVLPAGWVLLQMLAIFSFFWLVSGGNVRVHQAGYYFLTTVIIVVWLAAVIAMEEWFRASVDQVRLRRARATSASSRARPLPENRFRLALYRLGLDLLFPRVLIGLAIGLALVGLRAYFQQLLFLGLRLAGS